MRKSIVYILLFLCVVLAQSCSLIDDDLTDCAQEFMLNVRLRLETHLDVELSETLSAETDEQARKIVKQYLDNIFTDTAHDIDIMFFKQSSDRMEKHIVDIIDGTQSVYTVFLPIDNYHNISLANIERNEIVTVNDTLDEATANLQVQNSDTIASQKTGIFSASLPVNVNDSIENQTIEVSLKQVNCAVALVNTQPSYNIGDISMYVAGTASSYMLRDSLYLFDRPVLVKADRLMPTSASAPKHIAADTTPAFQCLTAVCLPAPDLPTADGSYFKIYAYVPLDDGSVTENILSVNRPLSAGRVMVIKTEMKEKGELVPVSTTDVGVTVTLNWKQGAEHDIDL